jgi:hypothetical protein
MTAATTTFSTTKISEVAWGDELTPAEKNDLNNYCDLDYT